MLMTDNLKLSIVIPTYNRISRLTQTVARVRANVSVPHELVIVDGGSTDGTRELLAADGHLHVILERKREGAVRAFNKGFRAARGEFVMWLNDDAFPLAGSVEAALDVLHELDDVGMAAFYHDWDRERNVLDSVLYEGRIYSMYNVRGYPYANFGLLRKSLLARIGYADERYYFFGFDPDLSLKVQLEEGLKVIGCRRALVQHEEYHDDRKIADLRVGDDDNRKLFAKWRLPEPDTYPDPRPAYQRMLHERCLEYADAEIQPLIGPHTRARTTGGTFTHAAGQINASSGAA
jgi:GT2 family glycosyltransferase